MVGLNMPMRMLSPCNRMATRSPVTPKSSSLNMRLATIAHHNRRHAQRHESGVGKNVAEQAEDFEESHDAGAPHEGDDPNHPAHGRGTKQRGDTGHDRGHQEHHAQKAEELAKPLLERMAINEHPRIQNAHQQADGHVRGTDATTQSSEATARTRGPRGEARDATQGAGPARRTVRRTTARTASYLPRSTRRSSRQSAPSSRLRYRNPIHRARSRMTNPYPMSPTIMPKKNGTPMAFDGCGIQGPVGRGRKDLQQDFEGFGKPGVVQHHGNVFQVRANMQLFHDRSIACEFDYASAHFVLPVHRRKRLQNANKSCPARCSAWHQSARFPRRTVARERRHRGRTWSRRRASLVSRSARRSGMASRSASIRPKLSVR